jgi:hypothetical protein
MRTTATYEHATHSFVLHTPDKEAAKWWVGNLGRHATHCVLAAQLIHDGQPRGLHWFVVQLRSLDTHQPLPGIIIGDIGKKMGWDAIDHGFAMFQYVRIPAEAMLNRYQVNESKECKYSRSATLARPSAGSATDEQATLFRFFFFVFSLLLRTSMPRAVPTNLPRASQARTLASRRRCPL